MFLLGKGRFGQFLDDVTAGPPGERASGSSRATNSFSSSGVRHRPRLTSRYEVFSTMSRFLRSCLRIAFTPCGAGSAETAFDRLHYDNNGCHNFNAQITGTKRCLLFAPSELSRLAPSLGGSNPAHNCSQIDIESPNFEKFPEFREASCYEATPSPAICSSFPRGGFIRSCTSAS